jgi:signal transduction histidine kinase
MSTSQFDSHYENTVLILAPLGKDAELMAQALAKHQIQSVVCAEMKDLCKRLALGVGAILLTEEALTPTTSHALEKSISAQAAWSDLPIIALLTPGKNIACQLFSGLNQDSCLSHITALERPVSIRTLISTVQGALRARSRQYLARDLLQRQADDLERLQRAQEEVQLAKESAEKANSAKSEFVANISHEIRTPLGVMLGFTELAQETARLPRDHQHYLSTVHRNGKQLLKLIEEVLDLAKIESQNFEIEKIDFSISDLIDDLHSDLSLIAEEKGIEFLVSIRNCLPEILCSDPTRVRQILFNIVGNAIKFTEEGSVQLLIGTDHSIFPKPNLVFKVVDTGIGLSDLQKQRLFKPFSQADSSTTRRFGGSGLGLVVARKFAQALGGDLVLSASEPDRGSTFVFTIPIENRRNSEMANDSDDLRLDSRKVAAPHPLKGMNVLVVDDSKDNQLMIGRFLSFAGAKVDLAANGIEGIDKALGNGYDAVLMDLQMPLLGGLEATRQLRTQGYAKPIIACTAHAMRGERERLLTSGFDAYLSKPIERQLLIETLRGL